MESTQRIEKVSIESELKQAYLDYAMSVIVGRALPDVRDGLKPVHRRVLFAMHELNNEWNKSYKKSARVVGDVIGKYHPHGESAVYDTIVRMAQEFSMRYCLVDGQGNFGSIDGDPPAAMRYTEIRMQRITQAMLADIDKETVDFVPNYDDSETMPDVLPARLPNLLVNGAAGIAVGMATNIPPHNLTEVINALVALIDKDDLTIPELMEHITGPDFPTGGFINGRAGIIEAYQTGRGKIYLRSKYHVEQIGERDALVFTEIPFQTNKARTIERIADLVREKRLTGIAELRDESDKDGIRLVVELRRGETPEVAVNNLFQLAELEVSYSINLVVLDKRQPKLMNLKEMLDAFIDHRRVVVHRRSIYELAKARDRAHLVEGLAVAISNLNPVIELIRASANSAEAKQKLVERVWESELVTGMLEHTDLCRPEGLAPEYGMQADGYHMSPEQAQAILDLRLHRLTGMERDKLLDEYRELIKKINYLLEILGSRFRLMAVVREELIELRDRYGDERKSEIISSRRDFTSVDLINEQQVVVTFSRDGYAKCQPLDEYRTQHRGGRGKSATNLKDEDQVTRLLTLSNLDTILCFSNLGKVYWLKVFEIPLAGRSARGLPLVNLLPLEEGESISVVLPLPDSTRMEKSHRHEFGDLSIWMATRFGTVKRTLLSKFARPRSSGLRAVELAEGDELINALIGDDSSELMLFSNRGKAIRFASRQLRPMGRVARGVRGIRLGKGDRCIAMLEVTADQQVLLASANGYGKRTPFDEFPDQLRGGQGVIAIQTSERNGELISACAVGEQDEVLAITDQGTLVRMRVEAISSFGRNTQGVRLINLQQGEQLAGANVIPYREEDEGEDSGEKYEEAPTEQVDRESEDKKDDDQEPPIH